jgi:uncharacterized protein (DUF885 family)
LQLELLRAVRLVVDTGIHAKQWTRAESKAYMNEALGDPSGRWSHEVERYIVWPAQASGYKIGMLKILELRQRAMDELGEKFDIKEFHNFLPHGPAPASHPVGRSFSSRYPLWVVTKGTRLSACRLRAVMI